MKHFFKSLLSKVPLDLGYFGWMEEIEVHGTMTSKKGHSFFQSFKGEKLKSVFDAGNYFTTSLYVNVHERPFWENVFYIYNIKPLKAAINIPSMKLQALALLNKIEIIMIASKSF